MKKVRFIVTLKHSLVGAFSFSVIAAFSQYNIDWILTIALYSWGAQFIMTFINAVINLRLFEFFKTNLYKFFNKKILSIHLSAIICWLETFVTTYSIQYLIWADVWFVLWVLFWLITYITFPIYQKILDNNIINRSKDFLMRIIRKYI
jgi:hypothetical protein